jgi:hypothetical protein
VSGEIVKLPDPPIDRVGAYLGLIDAGASFDDPLLAELREQLTAAERARLAAQLRKDAETTTRRADALEKQMRLWRTKR